MHIYIYIVYCSFHLFTYCANAPDGNSTFCRGIGTKGKGVEKEPQCHYHKQMYCLVYFFALPKAILVFVINAK